MVCPQRSTAVVIRTAIALVVSGLELGLGSRVRLLEDESLFREAFVRFPSDEVNGLSPDKLNRLGQEAEVLDMYNDSTITVRFDDGVRHDIPLEALEHKVGGMVFGQLAQASLTLNNTSPHAIASLKRAWPRQAGVLETYWQSLHQQPQRQAYQRDCSRKPNDPVIRRLRQAQFPIFDFLPTHETPPSGYTLQSRKECTKDHNWNACSFHHVCFYDGAVEFGNTEEDQLKNADFNIYRPTPMLDGVTTRWVLGTTLQFDGMPYESIQPT